MGIVSEADVDLLRRILYSAGSDGSIAITQAEAEVLFDIDEATSGHDNHPAWTDLFVKAIANCVMAASGYAAPPREIALAREAWLDRRGELSLDAMLGGMASGLKGLFGGYREQTTEERAIARLTQQKVEIITRETVTAAEATWLAERIGRDGKMTPQRARAAHVPEDGEPVDRPSAAGAGGQGGRGGLSGSAQQRCQLRGAVATCRAKRVDAPAHPPEKAHPEQDRFGLNHFALVATWRLKRKSCLRGVAA